MNILIVENVTTDFGRAVLDKVIESLKRQFRVLLCKNLLEAKMILKTNMYLCSLVISKFSKSDSSSMNESDIVDYLNARQPGVPSFYLNESSEIEVNPSLLKNVNEILFICQDSAEFIRGRIVHFATTHVENLLPKFTNDMLTFSKMHEYSWTIPGHQGIGMKKNPVGKAFVDFIGDNVFKLDLNSSRSQLGSLLGHHGSFLQSEKDIAEIFGSHLSYSGVVGGSGSNRTVMQYCVKENDLVVVDRNCHKSIAQGLILTGARAKFLIPTRNKFGMIGPFKFSDLIEATSEPTPYFVMTNCTFDGIIYNAKKAESVLSNVKYIHFDEAWFSYARFHPLYEESFAMRGDPDDYEGKPTIFATQSSHKMLNAFGQGSYIHVRSGASKVDLDEFDQSYMMHTTTSPSYILAASNDVCANMMRGKMGTSLMKESLLEAIYFRKTLCKLHFDYKKNGDWFFKTWNVERLHDGTLFHEIPSESLIKDQKYWILDPKDKWHGFPDLDESWCMLDPLKVSIITKLEGASIPAPLVSLWLAGKGVTICRNTEFAIEILFSLGVTKGKWITMVQYLTEFKKCYDGNYPLCKVLPDLVAKHKKYEKQGLKDLGEKMNAFLEDPAQDNDIGELLNGAFEHLPESVMTSRAAFQNLTANSEYVPLDELSNRISVTFVIPYPPGIPIIISGEKFGDQSSFIVRYLKALERWDAEFPGFDHDTTGVKRVGTQFQICVIKE